MTYKFALPRMAAIAMLATILLLLALPSVGGAQRVAPQHQAGRLCLVFPAGTQTSGNAVLFDVPYGETPVVTISVSSQNCPLNEAEAIEPVNNELSNGGVVPELDYMPTETGIAVVGVLDSPTQVDRVFTVDWRASLPTQ